MQTVLSGVIDLDRSGATPLYRQLYEGLRAAILSGRLPAGTRVPATRAMAVELGVARNTVLAAVEQLVAEGFLDARQGAATRVAAVTGKSPDVTHVDRGATHTARAPRLSRSAGALIAVSRSSFPDTPARAFRTGLPDVEAFPHALWGRLLRRAARHMDTDTGGYAHVSGHPRLREAIVSHLAEARGVAAEPCQVIVTSSAQAALFLVALALVDPGDGVWIEEPGYLGARAVFQGVGARLRPVGVDRDGMDPRRVEAEPPRLIYVTPSHQFPTGRLMSLSRRLALLALAETHGAYVIEDDFDSEFQYQGRPVAAMQGLDRADRVIYMGTFSKTMFPGLRIGFLVVPPALAEPMARMQRNTGHLAAAGSQLALAAFVEEGHYRAHIRRMRTLYLTRRDALVALLRRHGRDRLSVAAPAGGMQLVARFRDKTDDEEIALRLAAEGVEASALSRYYLGPPRSRGLFLGFAAWPLADIEARGDVVGRVLG